MVPKHDPASERPLLYRPGSPLRTPRDNVNSYGETTSLFLLGRGMIVGVAATDDGDVDDREIVYASHGQCTEWIERDSSKIRSEANKTAKRDEKTSNRISKGLPPVEPAAAMHDAVLSEVFDTLWFKISPLVLPLVRYIMNNLTDPSPFRRHDPRARTPSPEKRPREQRRNDGAVHHPRLDGIRVDGRGGCLLYTSPSPRD